MVGQRLYFAYILTPLIILLLLTSCGTPIDLAQYPFNPEDGGSYPYEYIVTKCHYTITHYTDGKETIYYTKNVVYRGSNAKTSGGYFIASPNNEGEYVYNKCEVVLSGTWVVNEL